MNNNFKWIITALNDSLDLEVSYQNEKNEMIKTKYYADLLLETTMDKMEVMPANISDITNLLTLGIIRFKNDNDKFIIDIPLRKIYKLYELANPIYEDGITDIVINPKELESFSILDDYFIKPLLKKQPINEFIKLYQVASHFLSLDMQEKFDALKEIDNINYHLTKEN